MNFPKTIAGKVERGEATLTIRPVNGLAPKPGARRCVKTSQKSDIMCHVIITDVSEQWAGEITFKQARACGYRTSDDWRAAWVALYDKAFMDTLIEMDDDQARTAAIARFERRHAGHRVNVIAFKLEVDPVRFLAQGWPDYTGQRHRSIDPDAEVIPPSSAAVKRAREEGERQRASFRADLERERLARRGMSEAQRRPMYRAA